ncbi:MAG: 4-(cytidine 5'-diphospho)-2-C-methyl-D-erythritol kinase [Mediterranea sp.]|nr:4-(cytidine 5'-diphospho)-2-C-methyl-D-erythritol kinase [Mediterranea sp.]
MITFPNAKINLGLSVVSKRADGYHDLETVFYPIGSLTDALEVVASANGDTRLRTYGNAVDGQPEENLVTRAYRLLAQDHRLPPVDIHLYKRIPSGAGLGGGSADAAFMLRLLNDYARLGLTDEELEAYAVRLGADCAFFVRDRPTYAEGIGNRFAPINLSLAGYGLALVKPDIFVSTREAFKGIHPHRPEHPVREVIERPVSEWRERLVNDFEESVFPLHPTIRQIKEELYRQGAVYASMTGSGSSVFGLFAPGVPLPDVRPDEGAFVYTGTL